MIKRLGPTLSDAANYADDAKRLLTAAKTRVEEARELEPNFERRLHVHLFGDDDRAAGARACAATDDGFSDILSNDLQEFERMLVEDLSEYSDYLLRLADAFGREEVEQRFLRRGERA